MVKLSDIFHIEYGNQADLNKLVKTSSENNVRFISRASENLGFQCYVKLDDRMKLYKKGDITVTLGGSYLLSAFVQPGDFYTAQNIKVLSPKEEMTDAEKYFYCYAISQNRFRYITHGREANKTLDDIIVPSKEEIPKWVYDAESKITKPNPKPYNKKIFNLKNREWREFNFNDLFKIKRGLYAKKPESIKAGNIPYIGATENNNGVTDYYSLQDIKTNNKGLKGVKSYSIGDKIFKGNCITISNNGSIGYAFYQSQDFTCSQDVNVLYLKERQWDKYIAIFICTLISLDRYRWSYGRKFAQIRIKKTKIKLPIDKNGEPDWQFMEDYIKSLPYSANL